MNIKLQHFLSQPGFELVVGGTQVALRVPSEEDANDLLETALADVAALAEQFRQRYMEIFWQGCTRRMRVRYDWKMSEKPVNSIETCLPTFGEVLPGIDEIRSASDLDFIVAIFSAKTSACLTTVAENKILQANFAVVPSHGKPYHQMIGSDLTPLWDEDELSRVMRPLHRDGYAHNLDYWTWKWEQQPNGVYTRTRQTLNRHFFNVNFAGVQCRLTIGVES